MQAKALAFATNVDISHLSHLKAKPNKSLSLWFGFFAVVGFILVFLVACLFNNLMTH